MEVIGDNRKRGWGLLTDQRRSAGRRGGGARGGGGRKQQVQLCRALAGQESTKPLQVPRAKRSRAWDVTVRLRAPPPPSPRPLLAGPSPPARPPAQRPRFIKAGLPPPPPRLTRG